MKRLSLNSVVLAVIFFLTVSLAHSQVISLNFDTDNGDNVSGPITSTTGIVPEAPTAWNELGFYNSGALATYTTAANSIFDNQNVIQNGFSMATTYGDSWQSGVTGFGNLINTYADQPTSITLSNIPYASYDIYLYVSSDTDGRRGVITDTDTGMTLLYTTEAKSATSLDVTSSNDGSYPSVVAVEFAGLTGSSATFNFGPFNGNNSGVSAIQIVGVVPEPSTIGFTALSLGAGMAWAALRRKRLFV